jgi:hypothetical protein
MNLELLEPKMGRPPIPKGDKEELAKCIDFFNARGITAYRISKVLNVSMTMAYRWFNLRIIPQANLKRLQELVEAVKTIEQGNQQEKY